MIDVIAVLDSDLVQLFPEARPVRASVREDAKLMEHPLETGAVTVDHKVTQPAELELTCILNDAEYAATFLQIKDRFLKGELCTIQTRVEIYENMLIQGIPHEEDADMQDAVIMVVRFKEVLIVQTQVRASTKTTKRGEQRPKETPEPRRTSTLSSLTGVGK